VVGAIEDPKLPEEMPAVGMARVLLCTTGMAYVITDPCVGTCDTACVEVCPVDCILGPVSVEEIEAVPHDERRARFPTLQLYIDPELCICCAACVPECPVNAIFDEDDVPEAFRPSIAANAAFFRPRTT
jgi:NAD-dependent dihydropyrimidine dehydrogenase PreA subunit